MDSKQDVPPLPEPWNPSSIPEFSPPSGGCGRPAIIGCGLLMALLLGGSILVLVNASGLFEWGLGMSRSQIFSALDDEVTAEQRSRLERAFDAVVASVDSGAMDPARLPILQTGLRDALRSSRESPLSVAQVEALIEALEGVSALEPNSARGEAEGVD